MKNKHFIILIAFVFGIYCFSIGQEVCIGVVVPTEEQGYTEAQSSLMLTKLENLCVQNGVSPYYVPNGFVLYPVIDIFSDEVVEGGMQSIYSVKAYLTLSVRRMGGVVVASTTKTISGAGKTRQKAMTSLIQSINASDPTYSQFLSQAKHNIATFYVEHCADIVSLAEHQAAIHDYKGAIALLYSVPVDAPCYKEVTGKMVAYYKQYQSQLCNSIKMEVEAAVAVHDYDEAASLLTQIDPSSDCYNYAMKQFKQIENEVSKLEQRNWNYKMKQHDDNVAIQKQIIKAAGEVAKAYYSSTPTIHYTQVIK